MSTHFREINVAAEVATSSTGCIVATLRMIAGSRSPQKGSKWVASCEWNGRTFEAQDRNSPVYALCRELVGAGCPDQPLQVRNADGHLELTIHSIHAGAKLVVRESNRISVRLAPYEPHPADSVSASKQGDATSLSRLPEGAGK